MKRNTVLAKSLRFVSVDHFSGRLPPTGAIIKTAHGAGMIRPECCTAGYPSHWQQWGLLWENVWLFGESEKLSGAARAMHILHAAKNKSSSLGKNISFQRVRSITKPRRRPPAVLWPVQYSKVCSFDRLTSDTTANR